MGKNRDHGDERPWGRSKLINLTAQTLIWRRFTKIDFFLSRRFCLYKIDPILIWGGGRE
jgi:hypothetical protein